MSQTTLVTRTDVSSRRDRGTSTVDLIDKELVPTGTGIKGDADEDLLGMEASDEGSGAARRVTADHSGHSSQGERFGGMAHPLGERLPKPIPLWARQAHGVGPSWSDAVQEARPQLVEVRVARAHRQGCLLDVRASGLAERAGQPSSSP